MPGDWIRMSERKTSAPNPRRNISTPISKRNISGPFHLAIPVNSQRRSTYHRVDTPTQYLSPPDETRKVKGTPYLELPKCASPRTDRLRPYALKRGKLRHSLNKLEEDDEPKSRINDRVLAFAVTFALAILIAIGIPLAVILPQKFIKPLPINVLVPFYVKPEDGGWNRLEDAIVKHHDTQFTVVVNPDNGPGNATWPSASFIEAVRRINIYPNVQTVGYINIALGAMTNATVQDEIATYAGWSRVTKEFALDGIYFDQTPWHGDEEGRVQSYLQGLSAAVRDNDGWSGNRTGLVVYNSGRIQDAELMETDPDITVIFEGAYIDMPENQNMSTQLAAVHGQRKNYAMLVNSVPGDLGRGGLRKIIEDVRREVEWLHLTDLTDNVYTAYGSSWEEWLDVTW